MELTVYRRIGVLLYKPWKNLFCTVLAPCVLCAGTLEECEKWFAEKGVTMIQGAARKMNDGTVVYAPQVGDWYKATWLRDYVMMLEGELVPTQNMAAAAEVFLKAVSPEGESCDCVKFDGTVMRRPGYDTVGENPVLDGYPYLVSLVYETWRQTGDAHWISDSVMALLVKVLARMPRRNGLPWIDPAKDYDRAPWGFTDSTRKTGNVLFCTLLEIRARRELAVMLAAADRPADARRERERVDDLVAKTNAAFWDPHVGLYYAATAQCRQHDIWGSAYAVWLGVADGPKADAIATSFRRDYAGLVQNGQVRHLRPGEFWQACNKFGKPGQYQNGFFWGTPVGWFAYTLSRIDPALADKTFADLTADYRARGPWERTFGEHKYCADYMASIALPLQGMRRLLRERKQ